MTILVFMKSVVSFFAGFMIVLLLMQGVFADSVLDDVQDVPLTNTTLFLLFLIVVILVALVLKYTHKRSDVERIRQELEEEEAERDFNES